MSASARDLDRSLHGLVRHGREVKRDHRIGGAADPVVVLFSELSFFVVRGSFPPRRLVHGCELLGLILLVHAWQRLVRGQILAAMMTVFDRT